MSKYSQGRRTEMKVKVIIYDNTSDIFTEKSSGYQEFEFTDRPDMLDFVSMMIYEHDKAVIVTKVE